MTRYQWLPLCVLGLLLASAPLIAAEEETKEEDAAVVLTKDNFDEKVKKAKFALVEFYAPWCGHCKRLEPEYSKAAASLKEHDASILIGKVDATVESDLGSKFGISGYPTLKWFVDGEVAQDYNGPRDAEGIVRWVKKKSGPPATKLEDKKALEEAEKSNPVLLLGYFKELKGDAYDAFVKAAQKSEDAPAFETTDAAVAKAAGLSSPGAVVVTNFEGEDRVVAPLKGDVTADAIEELINSNKLPPTLEFNDKNSGKIFGAGIPSQVLLVAKSDDLKPKANVFSGFKAAAKALKGKAVFVTVDLDGSSKDPVVNFFGVDASKAPVVVGFNSKTNKKFAWPQGEKISEKSVTSFGRDLAEGKLTPEYKSAAIPDEPKDDGVTVVVGKNFDQVVKDASKDVLLEIYAPWCGHCKQLEPTYKKLAKRFEKVDSVVIAKMDGTENEHPDVEVRGFPTILFYPAEEGAKAVTYDGGNRDLASLTKFVQSKAKSKFELPEAPKDEEAEEDAGEDDIEDDEDDHEDHDHDEDHDEDHEEAEVEISEEEAEEDKDEL